MKIGQCFWLTKYDLNRSYLLCAAQERICFDLWIYALPDYDYPPACIIVWGANLSATRIAEYRRYSDALKEGARLIVIDPRKTGGGRYVYDPHGGAG